MAKLTIGFCNICNTQQIWTLKPGNNQPNEFYAEINIALSNNTIAIHAVCGECAKNATPEQVEALLERIKDTWEDEMAGWATEDKIKKMRGLKAETYHIDRDTCVNKYRKLIHDRRQEKLKKGGKNA